MTVIHLHLTAPGQYTISIHQRDDPSVVRRIDKLQTTLNRLVIQEKAEMTILDDLKDDLAAMEKEVAHNGDVAQSGADAINKLVDQISHMIDSTTSIKALRETFAGWASHVKANSDKLGDAIAHVPSDNPPAPSPDPNPAPEPVPDPNPGPEPVPVDPNAPTG